ASWPGAASPRTSARPGSSKEGDMPTDDAHASPSPAQARPPRGINHVVLNVRDLELAHRFWTEVMGFRCVAHLPAIPGHRPRMRFYSGLDAQGRVTHHDVALAEIAGAEGGAAAEPWKLAPTRAGLNHVAVAWPDRESWRAQLAFLRSRGVPFRRRVNHG